MHAQTEPAATTTAEPLTDTVAGFRGLMSAFPTGVAVITAAGSSGRPYGLTCTSLASVTLYPPTLLVCLNLRSGTLDTLRKEGAFAVNLLHARAQRAAEVFSAAVPDRFAKIAWQPSPRLGQPWLCEDAFAIAECEVVDTSVVGDHAVVLGEVRHIDQTADVPLLYGLRRFSRWRYEDPC
ncbi:MAG TPA: flavin reductase family protein [Pseudonocardiaceae bacterium]